MKEVKYLTMDNRGRILIPQTLRKIAGFSNDLKYLAIADSERKELTVSAINLNQQENLLKIKVALNDKPGSLGRMASSLGELDVSILYSEGGIKEKGNQATYTALIQSHRYDYDEIKSVLINEGSVLHVELVPMG